MNLIFTTEKCIEDVCLRVRNDERLSRELSSLAAKAMKQPPLSVTFHKSPAKSGDIHDYFSEGPYWWPNPADPDGPYVRRDGEFNPDRFNFHSDSMRTLSRASVILAQAGVYMKNKSYHQKAIELLRVWFTDESTGMNPNLNHAQAIRGVCDGRGIGITDTAFLIRVVNAVNLIEYSGGFDKDIAEIKKWFAEYAEWLKTSKNGLEEKEHPNNHSNWWNTQLAAFSALCGNDKDVSYCIDRFFNHIIPSQTGADGSFTDEIKRTRSYHYEIYNLEASAIICEIAHHRGIDLWNMSHPDSRGMKKCVEFFKPYYENPFLWKHPQIAPDCLCGEVYPMNRAAIRYEDAELDAINRNRNKNIIPCSDISHVGIMGL